MLVHLFLRELSLTLADLDHLDLDHLAREQELHLLIVL
jgi:hypothetical protein